MAMHIKSLVVHARHVQLIIIIILFFFVCKEVEQETESGYFAFFFIEVIVHLTKYVLISHEGRNVIQSSSP